MWGLTPQDNNAQINAYKQNYGITNPCAGTEGGGPAAINIVNTGQPFIGYPTYIVVCPDRTVHYDVCWPPTASCFDPYFEDCGATGITALFEADIEELCAGGEVSFTDLSTPGVTSWEWAFEGGTPETSNEQNPVVMYETAGTFDVFLTVSDGSNSASVESTDMILVHALSEVTLESPGEVCLEWEPFELTGGMPEGGEYSGPGVMDGIFDPLAVGLGTFTISYTYMDEFDCESFAESDIIVTSCVGMAELAGSPVSVYPNPSTGTFHVVAGTDEDITIEVFNAGGQKVMETMIDGSGMVDLAGKPDGIYFLQLNKQSQHQIIRLVLMDE